MELVWIRESARVMSWVFWYELEQQEGVAGCGNKTHKAFAQGKPVLSHHWQAAHIRSSTLRTRLEREE